MVDKLVLDPFLKKIRILDQQSSFIKFIFIISPSGGLSKSTETKVQATYFNLISSFFKKNQKKQRDLELVSLPHFLHDF